MAYQQDYRIVGESARLMADQVARNSGLSGLLTGYKIGQDIGEQGRQTRFREEMAAAYNPQTGEFDARRGLGAAMKYDPAVGLRMMKEARLQEQQEALSKVMGGMTGGTGVGIGQSSDDPEPLRIRGERLLQLGVRAGNPAYVNAGKADLERYQAETTPIEIPMSDGSKQMVPKWRAREILSGGGVWGGGPLGNRAAPGVGGGGGVWGGGPLESPAPPGAGGGTGAVPQQGLPMPQQRGKGPTAAIPTQEDLIGYLVGKYGVSPYHAAAITGNLTHESAGLKPTITGDNGASYGLGQWQGPRRKSLEAYARASGQPIEDWKTQVDFLMWEMRHGPEQAAGREFFKTKNLPDATLVLSDKYFRPGIPVMENRQREAARAFRTSTGMAPPSDVLAGRTSAAQEAARAPYGSQMKEYRAIPGMTPAPDVLAGRTTAAQEEARAPYEAQMKAYQAELDRQRAAYQAELDYAKQSRLAQEQAGLDYAQKTRLAEEQQPREIGNQMEGQWIKETYVPVLKEAQAAPKMRRQLDVLEELNKRGVTGPGEQYWDAGRRFFIGVGLSPQSVDDKTATLESLQGIALQAANEMLLQATGQQTEGDVQRAQATFPSLEKTKEANQFLIDFRRATLNQVERQARFYSENRERFGATPSRMTQAWMDSPEGNASIWDDPVMEKWRAKTPGREEQRAQQASAGSQSAGSRPRLTPEQARAELERRRAASLAAPANTGATGVW